MLAGLWLLGVLTLSLRVWQGHRTLRRVVTQARPMRTTGAPFAKRHPEVDVLISSANIPPLIAGIRRPTIVLPAEAERWSSALLEAVFYHELGHLKRGDLLMDWCGTLLGITQWFNPLVWWAKHRMSIESERACDDSALLAGIQYNDYASHLLDIANQMDSKQALAIPSPAMARRLPIEDRTLRILNTNQRRRSLKRRDRFILAFIGVLFTGGMAAVAQEDPKATASPDSSAEKAPDQLVEKLQLADSITIQSFGTMSVDHDTQMSTFEEAEILSRGFLVKCQSLTYQHDKEKAIATNVNGTYKLDTKEYTLTGERLELTFEDDKITIKGKWQLKSAERAITAKEPSTLLVLTFEGGKVSNVSVFGPFEGIMIRP